METSWTVERCDQLRELKAAGFSASMIADKMGACTRNAVIGKLNRLGLVTPRTAKAGCTTESSVPKIQKKYVRRKLVTHGKHREMTTVRLQEAPVEINDSEIPASQRKRFFELEKCHCRWPIGEGAEMFFCGGPAYFPEAPYCRQHHKRAHDKAKRFVGERSGSYRQVMGKYA